MRNPVRRLIAERPTLKWVALYALIAYAAVWWGYRVVTSLHWSGVVLIILAPLVAAQLTDRLLGVHPPDDDEDAGEDLLEYSRQLQNDDVQ